MLVLGEYIFLLGDDSKGTRGFQEIQCGCVEEEGHARILETLWKQDLGFPAPCATWKTSICTISQRRF